jgi:hypothetical protein
MRKTSDYSSTRYTLDIFDGNFTTMIAGEICNSSSSMIVRLGNLVVVQFSSLAKYLHQIMRYVCSFITPSCSK